MRKRVVSSPSPDTTWLSLETLAQAEITSEDPAHPIESALTGQPPSGWQAAAPGEQTIRFLFDHPLRIRRIHLVFGGQKQERTQEFLLRWSSDGGQTYREILRQQYHFSPGTNDEVEDYTVDLDHLTTLEIRITPDIAGGLARASLARLQVS